MKTRITLVLLLLMLFAGIESTSAQCIQSTFCQDAGGDIWRNLLITETKVT